MLHTKFYFNAQLALAVQVYVISVGSLCTSNDESLVVRCQSNCLDVWYRTSFLFKIFVGNNSGNLAFH